MYKDPSGHLEAIDKNLSGDDQKEILNITENWFSATTSEERDYWHAQAVEIRENAGLDYTDDYEYGKAYEGATIETWSGMVESVLKNECVLISKDTHDMRSVIGMHTEKLVTYDAMGNRNYHYSYDTKGTSIGRIIAFEENLEIYGKNKSLNIYGELTVKDGYYETWNKLNSNNKDYNTLKIFTVNTDGDIVPLFESRAYVNDVDNIVLRAHPPSEFELYMANEGQEHLDFITMGMQMSGDPYVATAGYAIDFMRALDKTLSPEDEVELYYGTIEIDVLSINPQYDNVFWFSTHYFLKDEKGVYDEYDKIHFGVSNNYTRKRSNKTPNEIRESYRNIR